jgi:K+-transporting ATPase ATPase C chain
LFHYSFNQTMKSNLWTAVRLTAAALVLLGGIYTLAVLGIAQLTPGRGQGERIAYRGKMFYGNIGQAFTDDKYFASRPSAVNYNAAGSGGSNKGPANPEYLLEVQARIDTFRVHNPGVRKLEIPVDLITASGSGLDPNISVQAARVQVERISRLRMIRADSLQALIARYTEKPLWHVFGPAKINTLKLNIALDQLDWQ